jgi:DNA polymerase (family 10)
MEMRHLAKEKGMMLNQKGLYKNGVLIPAKNEREIFRKLGMEYLPPEERY